LEGPEALRGEKFKVNFAAWKFLMAVILYLPFPLYITATSGRCQ
jgi:hypothetical protein